MMAVRTRSRRPGTWLGVVLAGLAIGYVVYFGQILTSRGLFEYLGGDYRTFRSSAEIARTLGFAHVYDLAAQAHFQRPLHQGYSFGMKRIPFAPTPTPYLPVFVVPFLILPHFAPIPGFIFWTVLNAALLVLGVRRLLAACGVGWHGPLPFEMLLSLPVFLTLIFGQINIWLFMFFAEFLIASMRGHEVRSGLWLGGLLLKPQTVVLFLPGLLIARRFKVLLGWGIAAVLILSSSVALAGSQGMVSLLHLIRLYPGPLPTTFPESMMNWRAVTINQALVLSAPVAWRLAMSGLAMTLVLGLALWAVRVQLGSPRFFAVTLGTWAATAGVAWHSHVHMALPMVAPLLCLYVMGGAPGWLVHLWALAPSLLFLEEAFRTGVGGAHIVAGLGMLAVNSVVLMWAVSTLWSPRGRDQGTSVP